MTDQQIIAERTRLQAAALVPFKVYNRAMKARVLLRRQFMEAFNEVDVLLSPTVPYPPPKLEHFQLPSVDRVLDAVDDLQWEDA